MKDRDTGRTLAMIKALPESGAIVIVHNSTMRRYIEQMVRDVRGPTVAQVVKVRVVEDRSQADDLLRGARTPVSFDHAWFEHVRYDVLRYTMDMADGVNIAARIDAEPPRGDLATARRMEPRRNGAAVLAAGDQG